MLNYFQITIKGRRERRMMKRRRKNPHTSMQKEVRGVEI
jgi:hypothetical protein